MYQHECKMCGKKYDSESAKPGYCPDCRKIRQRERNKAYQERKLSGKARFIGSADQCAKCGKTYIVKSGSQTLCDDCIAAGVNLSRSKSNTRYRDEHYESVSFYVPIGEKEPLVKYINAHGMSITEFMNYAVGLAKQALDEKDEEELF